MAPSLFGSFTDPALLDEIASRSEVVTFDWENVPAEALERLSRRTRIAPPQLALATAQDRLLEKELFARLSVPTNRSRAVDSFADLRRAAADIGLPGVLKTRRLGYDGKGQQVIRKRKGPGNRVAGAGQCAAAVRGHGAVRLRSLGNRRARAATASSACTP